MLSLGFPIGADDGSVMNAVVSAFGRPPVFNGMSGEWDDLTFGLFNGVEITGPAPDDYRVLAEFYSVWGARTSAGELWLLANAPAGALIYEGSLTGVILHQHFKPKPRKSTKGA